MYIVCLVLFHFKKLFIVCRDILWKFGTASTDMSTYRSPRSVCGKYVCMATMCCITLVSDISRSGVESGSGSSLLKIYDREKTTIAQGKLISIGKEPLGHITGGRLAWNTSGSLIQIFKIMDAPGEFWGNTFLFVF